MTDLSKLFLTAAIVSLSVAAHAAPPPPASPAELQGPYGQQGQTITCSSDDGKRNYCNIDTRRGVQLTRQISGSPCVQNSTWGYDNRGLWVDQGCRAEFSTGGYGPGNQWQQGQQGQTVTCSSDDGKRNYCNVDTSRGVQLTRQISGSPCVQNSTWGYDNRGLWVDRGCRAEFSAGGYGPGNQWQPGQGQQGQTVTCSSDDGKRNYCNIDTRRGVQLTRQISGSPCVQNSTWGYDNRGLWVDQGCRAEFSAGGYGPGNQWQPGQQGQIVTCSSDNGKRNYCTINGLDPRSAALTRQISGSECRRDYSWGVDRRRGLWVDHGCRAEFQLSAGYR